MFKATPKNDAAIILGKSCWSIFSVFTKKEITQNKTIAPKTRNKIKPNGFTNSGITSLAIVKVSP